MEEVEVSPDLPNNILWKLARLLPDHQTNHTAHQTFCLLGRSWRNAYCSSRHAVTLHLGPSGLGGVASRVLSGSGNGALRLEVHMHMQAQVPLVAAALRSLPKLRVLILASDGLGTDDMAALAPALGALGGLRQLTLQNVEVGSTHAVLHTADAAAALAHALQHLTGLQHLHFSWDCLEQAGMAALAPAMQQLTGLLSLDLGGTFMQANDMAATIQPLTSLQKLVLDVSRLGAEGTAAMAHALKQLGGLQELALRQFFIGEGIGPLAPAIGGLTALRQLRISGEELDGSNLGAEDVAALAAALARLTGLQLLHLNNHELGMQGVAAVDALASALRQLTGLTELDLYAACLDAEATATLAPALGHLSGLVSLRISLIDVDDDDEEAEQEPVADAAAALAPALAALTQLTRLQLHGNYLSAHCSDAAEGPGMAALASAIGGLVRLQHLGIHDDGLGAYGARAAAALAAGLQQLTQLQLLEIDESYLLPAGVAVLAPSLRQLTGLRQLQLSALIYVGNNSLGPGGVEALAQALHQMTGMLHLELSTNYLGAAGMEVLAPALVRMPGLQHLDLGSNHLGVQGMVTLAPVLAWMVGLQHLALSFNHLGVQGMVVLAPVLAQLLRLQHLDLRSNKLRSNGPNSMSEAAAEVMVPPGAGEDTMGVEGVAALAPALAQLTGLTHLDLNGNDLGAQGVAALTSVLELLPRLRYVSLDD